MKTGFSIQLKTLLGIAIFASGFFSIFTAFYFKLGPVNMRVNDISFFIVVGFSIVRCIRNRYTINNVGFITVFFAFFVVVYYWINLMHLPEMNDVFETGALKFYFNRIPWILIYVFMVGTGGKWFFDLFIKGFVWGCVFNSLLMLLEGGLYLAKGISIDYSFLQTFFIMTQGDKSVTNQGFVRPTGVTVDTNYAAAYGVFAILLCEYLRSVVGRGKWKYNVLKIIILIPCFLVQSRTAIFGLLLTFVISVLLRLTNEERKIILPRIAMTIIGAIVAVGLYLFQKIPYLYETIYARLFLSDSSSGVRRIYLNEIISSYSESGLITLKNIFGQGTGSAGYFLGLVTYGHHVFWSPESNYITWFIEQGPFFISFYCLVGIVTFIRLLRVNNIFALCFLYLNLIGVSYNFLGDRVFWIMLIIFIAAPTLMKNMKFSEY